MVHVIHLRDKHPHVSVVIVNVSMLMLAFSPTMPEDSLTQYHTLYSPDKTNDANEVKLSKHTCNFLNKLRLLQV